MKNFKLLFFIAFLFLGACQSVKKVDTKESYSKEFALYQKSIESSMSPSPQKVYPNLVSITPENTNLIRKRINGEDYILMVTWKQNISYYEKYLDSAHYNTGSYPIWVTTAPELAQRMQKEKAKDVNLRLKQLLGLPPNAIYSYFIEFWVKPQDLFRPCPDSEITDNKCDLCFPENTDTSYMSWINENRVSRYYQCQIDEKYPWTQLGYTYDWNPKNKSHVGLSEFVIKENTNIIIKAIYTTEGYLNK
ncbi:hypothetical protein ACE193_17570 [Bernardetia sp. OM2101]|uniref:hypothetical protein n=1 Tax=Bernardetia sp. OM2101 TaxID=3344876 RepID=UPI0035D092A8